MTPEQIQEIIINNLNYFVMLRDLDDQHQQSLREAAYMAAEEILQNI
jgi:hypothetical protein